MSNYKYLFGPVPSRRFGRSLGIDLIPLKTCSLNCIFCQLGRSRVNTVKRSDYTPVEDVTGEIETWLQKGGAADYLTLSGSGEPTLHTRFGDVLGFIKRSCQIKAALLTNGTLLHLPEVRAAAAQADTVKISLSAWDQASFEQIHRPHPSVTFAKLVEGERAFRRDFPGQLWMEVFVIRGINSETQAMARIAALAAGIGPDRVHLNTAVRPPAEALAASLSRPELEALTSLFDPPAEVVADFTTAHRQAIAADETSILAMLRRRPCTAEQMAQVFGLHVNEVLKIAGDLLRRKRIHIERKGNDVYLVDG